MHSGFYTIGQIANIFHVKVDTIRYYENIGLVKCHFRDSCNNYRQYSDGEMEVLKFIFMAKELGFSLIEIKELLIIRKHKFNCPEIKEVIEKKIKTIDSKVEILNSYKQQLQIQLTDCKENLDLECHIFDSSKCH